MSPLKNHAVLLTSTIKGSERGKTPYKCHKIKWKRKLKYPQMGDNNIKPAIEEEDWEKEIEEFSRAIEMKNQPSYDSGDVLNIPVNGPLSNQAEYSPAIHHTRPVKWVRCVYAIVADQFADAEE